MLALHVLLCFVAGASVLALCGVRPPRRWEDAVVLAASSLALGLGLVSALFFLQRAAGLGAGRGLGIALEVLATCALAGAAWMRLRRGPPTDAASEPITPREPFPAITFIAFALLALRGWHRMMTLLLALPMGRRDAQPIWHLHARHLYRGGERWQSTFSTLHAFSHPDYPLLLPASVAAGWSFVGRETPLVPQLTAGFFTVAVFAVLVAVLARVRTLAHGLLAAMALLAVPYFFDLGTGQVADVPLAFWLLAALSFVFLADRREGAESRGLMIAAGLCAGAAAWTKNEGLLYVLAFVAARAIALWTTGERQRLLADAKAIGIGLAPALLCVAIFKLGFAPPNDLLSGQGGSTLERLTTLERWQAVFFRTVYGINSFSLSLVPPLVPALAGLAIVGLRSGLRRDRAFVTAALTVVLIAGGYFVTYVVTPQGQTWHMKFSMHRLFCHLWPSLLLCSFAAMADLASAADALPSLAWAKRTGREALAWVRLRPATFATIAVVIVHTLFMASGARDVGISYDEHTHRTFGNGMLAWYDQPSFEFPPPEDSPLVKNGVGWFSETYGGLPMMVSSFAERFFPKTHPIYVRHLVTTLFALIGMIFCVRLARFAAGEWAGLFAALVLALTPVWTGHGMFNPIDVPTAAMHAIQVFFLCRIAVSLASGGSEGPRMRDLLFFGIATGLTLGTRILAVLPVGYLGLVLIAWAVMRLRAGGLAHAAPALERIVTGGALGGVLAIVVGMVCWPLFAIGPVSAALKAAAKSSQFPFDLALRFAGERIAPWLWISLPALLLAGVVLGALAAMRAGESAEERTRLRVVIGVASLAVAFPAVYAIARGSMFHDAIRHLFFQVPLLAAVAGCGLAALKGSSDARGGRIA